MWLFQRDDTLDEDEDDCEFVLAGGGRWCEVPCYAGRRGGNRGGGGEGGCWSGGGGRLNMSRIVSGRLGGGALAEVGLRYCVSAIEAGQVLGAGGRVSEPWRVPQGMGDGGALEACVPPCLGGGGEGGRRGGWRCRAVCDVL